MCWIPHYASRESSDVGLFYGCYGAAIRLNWISVKLPTVMSHFLTIASHITLTLYGA